MIRRTFLAAAGVLGALALPFGCGPKTKSEDEYEEGYEESPDEDEEEGEEDDGGGEYEEESDESEGEDP